MKSASRAARAASAGSALALAVLLLPGFGPAAFAASATHTVVIEGMAFVPETLKVRKGDTIVWVNKDLFAHTATAQDRGFDSGEIAAGKSWKLVARKSGKSPYLCTLHPTMKGMLIVQ